MKKLLILPLILLLITFGCKKEPNLPTFIDPPTSSVNVSSIAAFEYNLELNIHTGYKFFDNEETCPWDCYYADITNIASTAYVSPTDSSQVINMQF